MQNMAGEGSNVVEILEGISPEELGALLKKMSRSSVAVVGDFCLDVYWTLNDTASKISVETGLATRPVHSQAYSPGGAGNVVMNLLDLGISRIFPIGILGNDPFGKEMLRLLKHPYVHPEGLMVQSSDWATPTYIKPLSAGQESNRIDFGNFNRLAIEMEKRLLQSIEDVLPKVSLVLVNHQVVGSIHESESFRSRFSRLMETHPDVLFIIDSRGFHSSYPLAIHKMNEREALLAAGGKVEPGEAVSLENLLEHGRKLSALWKHPLVVTRGDKGCVVFEGERSHQIFGVQLMGKTDPVGAGDTFVSALAAVVSSGGSLVKAAAVANLAAAVSARKLFQTGTATPAEIMELAANADYAYRPELAGFPHRAVFHPSTEIELIQEPPVAMQLRYAIFDHDGTISTLREGWERIMEPMMLKAILGEHFRGADAVLFQQVGARVRDFIDKTTGIQTINQMQGLVELVHEFGFVPEKEILDPAGYKEVYNRELKQLVDQRLAKLGRGELSVEDFTIKGSVDFLRALSKAGVKLFMASGTDEQDVRDEAGRLGYAGFFDGGIHGSVGDIHKDAKRVVLERMLQEVGQVEGHLVTFGDGPVEMRETVRRKGYAVGVASDENKRFELRPEKRSRLIRAGAQIVVPDFSQWRELWPLLKLPALT